MAFNIISWNFKREDGKVEVYIEMCDEQEDSMSYVIPKIRVPKLQILDLKTIVKQSQTIVNMRVFYSIYAKKIIEMEMGLIEMYNIKSENVYGLEMLQKIDKQTQFFRWGSIYDTKSFECQNIQQFVEVFEFYQNLIKERIFSIRTCLFYKNNDKRKGFPYNYLMLFDFSETIDFCLANLTLSNLDRKCNEFHQELFQQRSHWFRKNYKQDWTTCNNIIIPFQLINDNLDDVNLIIAELKQNETQQQVYQLKIYISEYKTKSIAQYIEYIKDKIIQFIKELDFKQIINEVTDTILWEADSIQQQFQNYVNYIEKEYFLITDLNRQWDYINKLPGELQVSLYNQALDGDFILKDEEQIIQYRKIFL